MLPTAPTTKSGQNEKNRSQNAQNERSRHFHKKAELTMSSYNSGAQPAYAKVVRLARIENPISTTIKKKYLVNERGWSLPDYHYKKPSEVRFPLKGAASIPGSCVEAYAP